MTVRMLCMLTAALTIGSSWHCGGYADGEAGGPPSSGVEPQGAASELTSTSTLPLLWHQLPMVPGLAIDVTTTGIESWNVYAAGFRARNGGPIYQLDGESMNDWLSLGGRFDRVSAGSFGEQLWAVDRVQQLHQFAWETSTWTKMYRPAIDVGVGADGTVYITGPDPTYSDSDGAIFRWTYSGWEEVGGYATTIDVTADGRPWVVNSAGDVFEWIDGWVLRGGKSARDIGVGGTAESQRVFIISNESAGTGYAIYAWGGSSNPTWIPVGSAPGGPEVNGGLAVDVNNEASTPRIFVLRGDRNLFWADLP